MRRSNWLRRAPRLTIVAVVVAVAIAATVAYAQAVQPAIDTRTPISEKLVTNIDVLRQQLKNYYGAPLAATGSGTTATWNDPLNTDSNYAKEARFVAKAGGLWLTLRKNVPKRAIVLDVDDTTLTTWNYELFSNWDFNPGTNANFVGLTTSGNPPVTTFTGNMFPATPGMVELVKNAKAMGYAVFFVTGRGDSQHKATIANLVNDSAVNDPVNYPNINTVDYSGKTNVPEIDAGYPMPTGIDTGHGGFTDGLFTKPPIGSYPAYLDKPEFCGPYIHATPAASCPTIQYKSGTRAYIESKGYDIVGNFGDQFSDLENGFADKTFKMPNPNYFLP